METNSSNPNKTEQLRELFKNKSTLIWDWNGTLLNDTELCSGIINDLLKERNLDILALDEHRRLFDFPVKNFYTKVGFTFEDEPFESISGKFIETYYARIDQCSLHSGVKYLLESFQKLGLSQCVLSASEESHLAKAVNIYGLAEFFDELIGIKSIHAEGKIETGKQYIQRSGLDKNEILLIGDTVHDFEVASALGVSCLLISDGHHHPDRLKDCGVPLIESLEELTEIVDKGF